MANVNVVVIAGRLTRAPEVKSTRHGQSLATFGLAVNRYYTRASDQARVEETTFVDVEVWGRLAETVGKHLTKGSAALVQGRLRLDQWESEGQRRSKIVVVGERVEFLDRAGSRQTETETDPR